MFKSDKVRRMLFAQDKDKQQGIPVNKSKGNSFQTANQSEIIKPMKPINSSIPQFKPSVPNPIKPTSVPSLPALPKMAKFAKVRKYFKKV